MLPFLLFLKASGKCSASLNTSSTFSYDIKTLEDNRVALLQHIMNKASHTTSRHWRTTESLYYNTSWTKLLIRHQDTGGQQSRFITTHHEQSFSYDIKTLEDNRVALLQHIMNKAIADKEQRLFTQRLSTSVKESIFLRKLNEIVKILKIIIMSPH